MTLTAEQSVLVIVDVQGKLATLMQNPASLSSAIQTLIKSAKLFDIPVLWVEQVPDKLGPTIGPIAELMADLYPATDPIAKQSFSSMGCREFSQKLAELDRSQVILTGIESHICVYQTARDLLASRFEVFAVIDAISSRTEQNYQLGLKRMEQLGAILSSVEMSLFELQQVAQGERFRSMVKLVS